MGVLSVPLAGSTEARAQPVDLPANVPAYNPYPSGILPANLQSELNRVKREVETIFGRYFAEYQALIKAGLPTLTGQPPTLFPSGYEATRILGGLLNFDLNMSPFRNVACSSCHMPYAGFSGPIPSVNLTMIAYPGSYRYRAGKRVAQRYTYSPRFPVLHLNGQKNPQRGGTFTGGNFWDGRSTGYLLQSPDAEQAQHPPVDTQEHGLSDTACIALRISQAAYRPLFELVWGVDFDINWPSNVEQTCATPGGAFGNNATPVALSAVDRTKANNIYDHWGQTISFLESSNDVSPFTSKVDAAARGAYTPTANEAAGRTLFQGKGNCNSCHLDGFPTLNPGPNPGVQADTEPLFTCFGYANLGLPLNPRDSIFYESKADFFGFNPNPDGMRFRDLGFGTFLRSGPGSAPNPNSSLWLSFAPLTDGQMQTSTTRNVAMTPTQCPTTEAGQVDANGKPIPYFQKEFFHNGYIKSLKQLVHFYNTRDVFPFNVTSGHCPKGTTEKVDCWPIPEVSNNLNMTIGKLGLSDQEENQLVIFLQALTDGFDPLHPTVSTFPNIGTFTGQCTINNFETASTQGNSFLIPTPILPPCAPAICGSAANPVPFPPNPPIP